MFVVFKEEKKNTARMYDEKKNHKLDSECSITSMYQLKEKVLSCRVSYI